MLTLLGWAAVALCAFWLYSDLKTRRIRKGWAAAISAAAAALPYLLAVKVLAILGTAGLVSELAPLVGAAASIVVTGGFSRPLSKQLRSGPPPS
jgi:hypothetical protein